MLRNGLPLKTCHSKMGHLEFFGCIAPCLNKAQIHIAAVLVANESNNLHSLAVQMRPVLECAGQVVLVIHTLCLEPERIEDVLLPHWIMLPRFSQLLIDAHGSDVPLVSLNHFTPFTRSIHQLSRHNPTPLSHSALQRSEVTPAGALRMTAY